MTKKNNLKLVPYAERRRAGEWDETTGERVWEPYTTILEYVSYNNKNISWEPNEPFTAVLTIDRLERGRSAARFWFRDEAGVEYPFFGQGLTEMLQKVTMVNGTVSGKWIAVKRGANYGLELYEED